jgi:hypothetical protein
MLLCCRKVASHPLYLIGARGIHDLRYIDDRVVFLPDSVRQELDFIVYSWPGGRQFSWPLQKLRECFPNLVAHVIHQYSHIDQVAVELHRELASWMEENALPDLEDIE